MQIVIGLNLLLAIAISIILNVINQKNKIIDKQNTKCILYKQQIESYQDNINNKNKTIINQSNQILSLNQELNSFKNANKHFKYLGKFLITYYDLSFESCGKTPNDLAYGHTYSGAIVAPNVTVAVDKSVISLGSYLYIEGIGCRIAQDIGGKIKGNHIDCYVNDFSYEKYHTHYTDVYLIQ
jgi:3D (Asp-Asp-Asp) domain-containing protein